MEKETLKVTLAELREKLGSISKLDPPPGWSVGDSTPTTNPSPRKDSLILPRGALVEWVGENAESALCSFFNRHPETQIAWIEKKLRVFPPAFPQRGVSLRRVLFVESEDNWQWSLQECVRSGTFQFIVASEEDFPTTQTDLFLRKLQLLSERSRTTVCFVARTPIRSYSIRHRIEASEKTGARVKLKRDALL